MPLLLGIRRQVISAVRLKRMFTPRYFSVIFSIVPSSPLPRRRPAAQSE